MRQLKQLFVGVLITMMVVLVLIFIYRDDDIDPMMPDFPPNTSTEEKSEYFQKKWQGMEKIALDSPEATNLVKRLVQEKASHLQPSQQFSLTQKLTSWLYQLKSGSFEDFLAFRDPNGYQFSTAALKVASYNLYKQTRDLDGLSDDEKYEAWNSLTDKEKIDLLDKTSDKEKLELLHAAYTNVRFDSLRADSIHLNVRNWKTKVDASDVMNPFNFYPDGILSFHKHTPIRYRTKPADVMKKHWGIEWARFRAGYDSPDYEGYVFAIQLALYWSPDEERWLAGECLSVGVPNSLLSKAYLSENMDMRPNIYF